MSLRITIIGIGAFGLLGACSALNLDRQSCTSDGDCSAFGSGSVCAADGYCRVGSGGDPDAGPTGPVTPNGNCEVAVCAATDEDDAVINIGNVSAQNGPNENLGTGMVTGIRAAFHQVNLAGGVNGHALNLVVRDDMYEPDNTSPAMQELTEGGDNRKVLAIVGNVGTPTAAVAIPIAEMNEVVFFGAFTGAGVLRQVPPSRFVFNYRASYVQETSAIVEYLVNGLDIADRVPAQNIGVLAQGNMAAAQDRDAFDGYGTAGYNGVKEAVSATVAEDDIRVASYQRNTSDVAVAREHFIRWLVSDAVTEDANNRIKAAIVMVPTAGPASALILAMRSAIGIAQMGGDVPNLTPALTDEERMQLARVDLTMSSVSFVGSDKLAENLRTADGGTANCPGTIVAQVVPFPNGNAQGAVDYRAALTEYNDAFGEADAPGFVSFEGYLAGRLFADGLLQADNLTTDGLIDSLTTNLTDVMYGIGTTLAFSTDDHQASDTVFLTELTDSCEYSSID